MGISKALMEKIAIATARTTNETIICLTRYGNVMASRGSVIPLFFNQIKNKEAITITDPNMTRFLMSLDDAVDLVLFAFKNGKPGDLFVNKAPAGTIINLAKAILKITNSSQKIKIIGTRHGEKLYETLCTREEMLKAEDMGNFYKIPADNRDLNYNLFFNTGNDMNDIVDYNSNNTLQLDENALYDTLLNLPFVKNEILNLR
jgi:UDP-glucose 4-epimerase